MSSAIARGIRTALWLAAMVCGRNALEMDGTIQLALVSLTSRPETLNLHVTLCGYINNLRDSFRAKLACPLPLCAHGYGRDDYISPDGETCTC